MLDAFAMALQEVFINIGWSGWYEKLGFALWQAGAWGDIGKPDSGQYHYMDTDKIGGVSVELIHRQVNLILPGAPASCTQENSAETDIETQYLSYR